MPSELADFQGLSPSPFLVEDDCFGSQIPGVFRQDVTANYLGDGKPFASSPFEKFKPRDCRMENFFDNTKPYLNHGTRGAASYSSMLQSPFGNDVQERQDIAMYTPSYFTEGRGLNMPYGVQNENSLFSSSFSDLFTRKMKVSSNNLHGGIFGHSVNGASHQDEEPFEFPEEIEAKTIGSLLPDDDELLSGVTDGLDHLIQTQSGDDLEDLDIFSSIGGMDLGDDISNGNVNGDAKSRAPLGDNINPYAAEHPSRTLFVRNINSNVEDSELRALFECYGDIHTLYTTCKHRGFVMISYYDIRASKSAMEGLQNKPLRRRKLDIHFSIPKDNPSERDTNQGTLVVFNLDSSVTNDELRQIFGAYGDIKEIQDSHGNHHKMIEFFDIRAADAAFRALNCSEIAGSRIKLEQSHPGMIQQFHMEMEPCGDPGLYLHQTSSSCNSTTGLSGPISHHNFTVGGMDNDSFLGVNPTIRSPLTPFLENPLRHGIPSNVSSNGCIPSPIGSIPIGNQPGFEYRGSSPCNTPFHFQPLPDRPDPHTEYHDSLVNCVSCQSLATLSPNITPMPSSDNGHLCRMSSNTCSLEGGFGSPGNGGCPPGHRYMWHSARPPRSVHMVWPESSPFVNGVCNGHHHPHTRMQVLSNNGPSHILNAVAPINNCHAGSAPAVNPSLWERRCTYTGESPQANGFMAGSLGAMRVPKTSLHHLDFGPHTMFPRVGGGSLDVQISPKNIGFHSPHQRGMIFPGRGQMIPMMSPFESPNDRGRSRRNEGNSIQSDNKKQYDLDLDRIVQGDDSRTTLMIKNIPNKYTSKMLLATIDERHRGMYDFLYLPIDFKNKCNVGYAFINMTEPSQIIPFYQAFNGKKWEKFNSEKVASLAYARIQGKAALIAHFQNSSLMNEDKRCRPILFNTDGPNAGDQVPFPIGVNVRPRAGRCSRSVEDNSAESLGVGDNREESSSD